jgi:nickel-dependent lactate racemase
MTEDAIDSLLGIEPGCRSKVLAGSRVFNHEWDNPSALERIGAFTSDQVSQFLAPDCAMFARDIDVTINRLIFDYDAVLIAGPVFPHEVVGFSGGAKYFFPGICGPELLNFFHWLGALITIPRMIGVAHTPVRSMLHEAARMVAERIKTWALCMVVTGHDVLRGLHFGPVEESWSAAAEQSSKLHIRYLDRPFDKVISCAPEMYDELWVGAKCMYKLECAVADGGQLIIYAPHISEISEAHGRIIEEVGYHCLPYFTRQWDRFRDYPWGILAHSTHVKGIGTFSDGIERPRIDVMLATGIPEETCRRINLGYMDPASIDPAEWQGREEEGVLCVPRAGEILYRLADPPDWQRC